MNVSLWDLPGVSRFLRDIAEAAQNGNIVYLRLPGSIQIDPLRASVEPHLSVRRVLHVEISELDRLDIPLLALSDFFRIEGVLNIGDFVRSEVLFRTVLWIDGLEETLEFWPAWKQWIDEYQAVARNVDASQRPALVLPLRGDTCETPGSELIENVYYWRNVINSIDLQLLAEDRFGQVSPVPAGLPRELAIAMACELAGYDLELVELLAEVPLNQIVNPFDALERRRAELDWQPENGAMRHEQLWACGQLQWVNGRPVRHLLSFLPENRLVEIKRRLWRAQVRVLFPLLEEAKLDIALKHRQNLARLSPETEPEREDIGRFCTLVGNNRNQFPHHVFRLTRDMHKMRTRLAHLEPLTDLDIMDGSFVQWYGDWSRSETA